MLNYIPEAKKPPNNEMRVISWVALRLVATVVIAANGVPMSSQTTPETSQTNVLMERSANLALSIQVLKSHYALGEKPKVLLTVENLTGRTIAFPDGQVHVAGPDGEPPTTLLQRQWTHRLNPGEPDLMGGSFRPEIHSGDSKTETWDLSAFYDFSKSGKYFVYIEEMDYLASTNSVVRVRTGTATFEVGPTP